MHLNFPTKLTVLRLALIPPILLFMASDFFILRIAATFFFILACLTDYWDGKLARANNLETTLGTFLDPLADKLLVSSVLITFIQLDEFYIPAWMVVLIIGREFLITGLRSIAMSKGRVISASKAGKFKTIWQMILIGLVLLTLNVNSYLESFLGVSYGDWLGAGGVEGLIGAVLIKGPYWYVGLMTILTVVSGYDYIKDHRDLF